MHVSLFTFRRFKSEQKTHGKYADFVNGTIVILGNSIFQKNTRIIFIYYKINYFKLQISINFLLKKYPLS